LGFTKNENVPSMGRASSWAKDGAGKNREAKKIANWVSIVASETRALVEIFREVPGRLRWLGQDG
jgi:hypothetical protein